MVVRLHSHELAVATRVAVHEVVVALVKLAFSTGVSDVLDFFSYQGSAPVHSKRTSALPIPIKMA